MLSGLEKRCNTLRYYTLHKLFLLGEAVLASAASNHNRLAAQMLLHQSPAFIQNRTLPPVNTVLVDNVPNDRLFNHKAVTFS